MAPPQTTRFQPALRFLVISTMVIVGAITGLMLTLSWPNTLAMQTARKTQCLNNLREVVNALQTYAAAKDHFPPPFTTDADGKPLHSWRTLILPYMDQSP